VKKNLRKLRAEQFPVYSVLDEGLISFLIIIHKEREIKSAAPPLSLNSGDWNSFFKALLNFSNIPYY